ncbi:MAG: DUF3365 domain-containing protein [Nitrospira sp.]|jgi:hypothetical protein|nr:DUF3365 domain-containing protein [Nitrospira sp.]
MNRPLLVVLGAITVAFMSVIFFWVFKLTMADSKKSDMVAPEKVASFMHALLEANRANYTDNVVVKLQKEGIEAHEHWKDERGVPLPAQYLMESGRLVALKDLKFTFRLASLTPIYVWNGANSDLERLGLAAVEKQPDHPHYGFLTKDGTRYFQAIYADRATSQACVDCHNKHPNSPRRDFKLNDVMGGIVITFPVGE